MTSDDRTGDDATLHTRLENELLRAQLADEHGMQDGFTSERMTPEAEQAYLKRIRDLEAGGPESYVAPGDLIGRKFVKRAAAMARRRDFERANATLLDGLFAVGIATQQPDHVNAREYYRFLIRDLFVHTVPKPPQGPPDPSRPNQRHCIGIMYEQVIDRKEREGRA